MWPGQRQLNFGGMLGLTVTDDTLQLGLFPPSQAFSFLPLPQLFDLASTQKQEKQKGAREANDPLDSRLRMNQVTKFDGTHEDLIHDVSFNYYGNRLGTGWHQGREEPESHLNRTQRWRDKRTTITIVRLISFPWIRSGQHSNLFF